MPRINFFVCSGVYFLLPAIATAQSLPKNPTIQQVAGYQKYQQQQWSMKQLPSNSVLYRYYSNSLALPIRNSFTTTEPKAIINLDRLNNNISRQGSYLQSYLEQRREQNFLQQKQSWYKDPSKGFISTFLKDVLYNSNNFIHR
jgi:hypothetical protein